MSAAHRILYVEDESYWFDLLLEHVKKINDLRLNRKFKNTCELELVHAKTAEGFISTLTTQGPFDLALIDLQLIADRESDATGADLLLKLKDVEGVPPRVVLTAHPAALPEEKALDLGITEYYLKDTLIANTESFEAQDSHRDNIRSFLETFFDLPSRYDFNDTVGRTRFDLDTIGAQELQDNIVGDELCMWKVKAQIAAAARSDLPVLITGESGTGKELAAYMIHHLSERGRENNDWVAVNCAAFTPDLLMSELFGHVKGAYTDARSDKRGLLEEANKSTLFLDEVGHAGYRLQVSLLRALSTGRARRLGATEEYSFDVRLVAATDQDVFESQTLQRSFVNRLAGTQIRMPPLRERKGDIGFRRDESEPLKLVSFFAEKVASQVEFTPAAIMALKRYDWPGNVRELSNIVKEASQEAVRSGGESPVVDAAQINWFLKQSMARLSSVPAEDSQDDGFARYIVDGEGYKSVERQFLAHYVHHMHCKVAHGERSKDGYERTARALGCSASTVKAKLADYDRIHSG
jgi:DNA-binding NtrC family response regulator